MDSFQIGAVISVFALMILAIFVLPIAYRHDRRRPRSASRDGAAVTSAAVFSGDDGGCSDGGGGSC